MDKLYTRRIQQRPPDRHGSLVSETCQRQRYCLVKDIAGSDQVSWIRVKELSDPLMVRVPSIDVSEPYASINKNRLATHVCLSNPYSHLSCSLPEASES
jgi:hypothetical protein